MNDQRQPDLLEQYLAALRHDPNAAPPPGLDPSLAAFVRRLANSQPAPGSDVRARVWQRALLSTRAHQNGRPHTHHEQEKPMTAIAQPAPRRAPSYALAAAVLALALFGALFTAFTRPPQEDLPLLAGRNDERNDATPAPTLVPTSTPFPALMHSPVPPADMQPMTEFPATFVPHGGMYMDDPLAVPTIVPPFVLQPAEVIEIDPSPDTTVEGGLTPERQAVEYRFTAPADGSVFVGLTTTDLSLIGLSYNVMREGSGGGGGGGGGSGYPSPIPMQVASMSFQVTAGDQVGVIVGSTTGGVTPASYTLRIIRLDIIPLTYGQSAENNLNDFVPLAHYTLEGEADDMITVSVEGEDGFDAMLELMQGQMPVITDLDGGAGHNPEIYRFALPASGTYHLIIRPQGVGGGRFKLTLERETRPSLDEGTQTVRFNGSMPPTLSYSGSAGENVQLNLRLPASASDYAVQSVSVSVLQDGHLIALFERGAATGAAVGEAIISGGVTIPADGQVLVQISAQAALTRPSTQQFALDVELTGAG